LNSPAFTPLSDWLTFFVTRLRRTAGDRHDYNPAVAPLIFLLSTRLGRILTRFHALVARLAAGRPAAPRRQRPARPARPAPAPDILRLPRQRFWMFRLLPRDAAGYGSQLQAWLATPQGRRMKFLSPVAV